MLVETYEVAETLADGSVETMSDPAALDLIESLGLRGQRSLLVQREAGDDVAVLRIPYAEITAEQARVFRAICPQATALEAYSQGPIPLRVLQVAAHATSLGCFKELYVWHPSDAREKDPVLVALRDTREPNQWSSGGMMTVTHTHLLARWGDELPSFEELRIIARDRVAARMKNAIEKARAELSTLDQRLESAIDEYLRGGETPNAYVNVSVGA